VGKAGSRRTRLTWRGMVWLQRPLREQAYASTFPHPPQRIEVDGYLQVDQGSARQDQEQQAPAQRQTEAWPDCGLIYKKLASRFYQLEMGHCLTGQYLLWTARRPDAKCWWCQYKTQTREHLFKNYPQWKSQQKTLWATILEEARKCPGLVHTRDRTKIAELFADERCSKATLDFLATTDVGKTAGPPEAVRSQREREGHLAQMAEEEARLGGEE